MNAIVFIWDKKDYNPRRREENRYEDLIFHGQTQFCWITFSQNRFTSLYECVLLCVLHHVYRSALGEQTHHINSWDRVFHWTQFTWIGYVAYLSSHSFRLHWGNKCSNATTLGFYHMAGGDRNSLSHAFYWLNSFSPSSKILMQ